MPFNGLPKDFFAFFSELKENNAKSWFEANRERFKKNVQAPLVAFVEDMAPRLKKISKCFVADARLNGGSIFRIHRDVRFSNDKRPYKTNAGVHFRHQRGKDAHAPGFYVHLAPGEIFYGGGVWMPPPPALLNVRTAIRDKGQKWLKAKTAAAFDETFHEERGHARLVRPPRGFNEDDPNIEDIKRTSFFVMAKGSERRAKSAGFLDDVETAFRQATPLMKFLCDALDVPF